MKFKKKEQELRLVSVPLCAGIICATARCMTQGWNESMLFSGFLFGTVVGVVFGIPLLLRSDANGASSNGRNLLNALIQSLVAWLLGGASLKYLPLAIGSGIILWLLFSATIYGIERLYEGSDETRYAARGWVYAVPLSGAITLGTAAALYLPGSDESIPAFILMFMVGGLLSMLVGWPVLWFTERYLQSPLRYIAGGMITGLLIWVFSALPNLVDAITTSSASPFVWPMNFSHGALVFVFIGIVAGSLCTAINSCIGFLRRRNV